MIEELGRNRARLIVSIGSRGNRRRFCKTVEYKTKRELKKLYQAFEEECAKRPQTDITVKGLLDKYIVHMRTMGRRETTLHGYQTCVKRLQPLIDGILAQDLTTAQLEEKIALMSSNGLSAKTIKNTIGLLSAAYRYAIKIDLLNENPCSKVTIPKGDPREIRILHLDEIQPFLNAIAECDIDERVGYELALFLGLRRSEILGLKESDVDIVNGFINVHETRHRVDGEDITSGTKTKRSTRVLALPDVLLLELARLLEVHRQFPYEKTDYLIQDGFGNPMGGQALSSRLDRLEKEKGLPHVTLHGLRHTYASILHSQGVDMANISAELGHGNLTTTANIYTHILNSPTNASKGIANTINNLRLPQNNVAKNGANGAEEKPLKR